MVVARQKKAVQGKPRGTGARKKMAGRGTAKMKAAADKTLSVNSEEIAQALLNKTLAGNTTSAKLLFALAEGQIDCDDEAISGALCSQAQELASEPEWDGEVTETEAETSFGKREPEG
jgi:hypothetical protein